MGVQRRQGGQKEPEEVKAEEEEAIGEQRGEKNANNVAVYLRVLG